MPDAPSPAPRRLPLGLLVVGSEMASFTVAGLAIDYFAGTMPGFTIGLTLLGLVAAFTHMLHMAKAMSDPPPGAGPRP